MLEALMAADEWEPFKDALADAVNGGPDGEHALIQLVNDDDVADWKLSEAIGAIGECDGDDGVAFLRELVESDEVDSEYRYPAIVGLTKRIGADITGLLGRCLTDEDRQIRDIAAWALAYSGDASQWEAMWGRLERLLAEPAPVNPNSWIQLPGQAPRLITIVYLARHAMTPERQDRLVDLIRSKWDRFLVQEQRWLAFALPATAATHDSEPFVTDVESMVDWVKHPVFDTRRQR